MDKRDKIIIIISSTVIVGIVGYSIYDIIRVAQLNQIISTIPQVETTITTVATQNNVSDTTAIPDASADDEATAAILGYAGDDIIGAATINGTLYTQCADDGYYYDTTGDYFDAGEGQVYMAGDTNGSDSSNYTIVFGTLDSNGNFVANQ